MISLTSVLFCTLSCLSSSLPVWAEETTSETPVVFGQDRRSRTGSKTSAESDSEASSQPKSQTSSRPKANSNDGVLNDAKATGDSQKGVLDSRTSDVCSGSSQLTGLDAEVFETVKGNLDLSSSSDVDESGEGTETKRELTCVTSTGFTTTVTPIRAGVSDNPPEDVPPEPDGTEENLEFVNESSSTDSSVAEDGTVQHTKWFVWYKNDKDEEIDKSIPGNYDGVSKGRIAAWLNGYSDQLGKVNTDSDGTVHLPVEQDYVYTPAQTDGLKPLDFWSDLAGYYDIYGDPLYTGFNLESKQHFAYTITETTTTYSLSASGSVEGAATNSDGTPVINSGGAGGSYGGGGAGGGGFSFGTSEGGDSNPSSDEQLISNTKGGTQSRPSFGYCLTGATTAGCANPIAQSSKYYEQVKPFYYTPKTGAESAAAAKPQKESSSTPGSGNFAERAEEALQGVQERVDGDKLNQQAQDFNHRIFGNDDGDSRTIKYVLSGDTQYELKGTDHVETIDGTEEVVVASGVIGSYYASQISGFDTFSLLPGTSDTVTGTVLETPFYGTLIPDHWENDGDYEISNEGEFYHYDLESYGGTGVNTIKLYGHIENPDRLYPFINTFSDITQMNDGAFGEKDYPIEAGRKCLTVNNIESCATARSPLEYIRVDLQNHENLQDLTNVEKRVIHADYYNTSEVDGVDETYRNE